MSWQEENAKSEMLASAIGGCGFLVFSVPLILLVLVALL